MVVVVARTDKKPSRHVSTTPKRVHLAVPPSNPHQHASKIAESVDRAWYPAHGTSTLEIPLSVIAALSLLTPPEHQCDEVAMHLLTLDPPTFATLMRTQWAIFINYRPDLVNRAWPLIEVWYHNRHLDEQKLTAAKKVADEAIRAGQLHLTGTDRRRQTDLFGTVLTTLRAPSAASARGQFYTPAPMADTIARLVGAPAEGDQIMEPAAGTGGLLCAAAEAMRDLGRDPTTVEWYAVDIDYLTIACLAVNTVLWELGEKVILGVGNGLTDEWLTQAIAERRETIELAHNIRRNKLMLHALRSAEVLIQKTDRV
ncbi:MAG: N-6 DNA methylase [Pseudonocardiales bacterium]|nr:N-6 DNA methylase [Pseudonocardiales bacterium]